VQFVTSGSVKLQRFDEAAALSVKPLGDLRRRNSFGNELSSVRPGYRRPCIFLT